MPSRSVRNETLPSPWVDFLRELDELLPQAIELHCLGGFVVSVCYGLPRPTADVDYIAVRPSEAYGQLDEIAGRESQLAKKHKVYLQHVSIATYPENYEQRLVELFPQQFRNLRLLVLDPYDLVLSKLERNSPKDREDVANLAARIPLDRETLRERYEQELRPNLLSREEYHDRTLSFWLETYFTDT
ncbi:MAG TPA: DUF6036 family nucleotidyltransferase [Acidobacteriota bacterium]|jgi:hypothetical protein